MHELPGYGLIASFMVGVVGSSHCLGMCGPLVLAYSLHMNKAGGDGATGGAETADSSSVAGFFGAGFLHHAGFHAGRLLSYGLLGALGAGLFQVADPGRFFSGLRGSMTLLGGILMVLFGLSLLNIFPLPAPLRGLQGGAGSLVGRLMGGRLRSGSFGSRVALGFAAGFLPCGLSWAMMARAAATRSITDGFLTMAAFGLGTLPALFLVGFSASLASFKLRLLGERAAAVSVIGMGGMLILKGARVLV